MSETEILQEFKEAIRNIESEINGIDKEDLTHAERQILEHIFKLRYHVDF